jgi:hypothetical protein
VDELLGKRKLQGGLVEYLVRWVNKPGQQPYEKTWEPAHYLTEDLIRNFEAGNSAMLADVVAAPQPIQALGSVVRQQSKVIELAPAQYGPERPYSAN